VAIRLLGRFSVAIDGTDVNAPWRLRKAKTLVKLLALAPRHGLHRDVLIDQLWPESDPRAGANNFNQALHAARKVIGAEHIALHDELVVLGRDGDLSVDIDDFESAAEQAFSSHSPDDLGAALTIWEGELLPEDLYEDWAAPHRERLNITRSRLVAELTDALLAEGRADEAVALVEPAAAERPADEALHRSLLVALAAAGRRWDAAAAFERLRVSLEETYGDEPEPETTAAYRRLFVGGTLDATAGPHNLPSLSTSFVGRHRELSELHQLLERTRLLTLTGPGGAGKTRLAIELAHRQAADGRYRDGVWLVELAGVTDDDGVASEVARALQLERPDRAWIPTLVEQLESSQMLLVLDNCEHVLDAVVPFAVELLSHCAGVVMLTTSREPIGEAGEVAWRVPSLELPGAALDNDPSRLTRLESVQLFVERAHDASPGFTLDAGTAPAVAEICRTLDGIPLALELAAARVAHLSVAQLSARLGDALTVLARRGRRPLDRQMTLAATLDWSHDLLLEDERTAFRRLAVFMGGFELDGATAVCGMGDVVEMLGRLVDKSLVVADTTGAAARFRVLEVVRQYAEARLREAGELDGCRDRHLRWYAGEAARHDPDRGVPVVLEPSAWFDTEQDNLRAALASAIAGDSCLALELAASTWRFLMSRGQLADCLTWLSAALDACPERSLQRTRALFARGVLHIRRGELEPIADITGEITTVCEQLGDKGAVASALDQAAIFMLMAHDWANARRLSAEAGECEPIDLSITARVRHFDAVLALALGDTGLARGLVHEARDALDRVSEDRPPFFTTLSLCWVVDNRTSIPLPIGEDTMLQGRRVGAAQARAYVMVTEALAERVSERFDLALDILDEASKRFAALDDIYGRAFALIQRAHTLRWAGDLEASAASFADAEQLRRSLRDLRAIAMAMAGHAYVDALLGDAELARARGREALTMMQRTGDMPGVAITVNTAALIELEFGAVADASRGLEASVAMADRVTPPFAIGWQYLLAAHLRHTLGDGAGSARAAAEASVRFEALEDERGRLALQSACKSGAVTMHS
jgi:predicted ATPase/DNA-binding SARP family transcriptional activator